MLFVNQETTNISAGRYENNRFVKNIKVIYVIYYISANINITLSAK